MIANRSLNYVYEALQDFDKYIYHVFLWVIFKEDIIFAKISLSFQSSFLLILDLMKYLLIFAHTISTVAR